jgi:glucose/arabinose dehydrogenase
MGRFSGAGLLVLFLLVVVACQQGDDTRPIEATAPVGPTREPVATGVEEVTPSAESSPPASATPAVETETATRPAPSATAAPASTPTAVPVANVQLVPLLGGFEQPTYLTHAFDTRLFVVEQPGRIQIVENGSRLATPFLDIAGQVGSGGSEQGLLSVAFHPLYAANGFFYVNYTDLDGDTVIARYRVGDNPAQADPDSEQILLTIGQPYGNHNGGQLQFGPDGYLYVGMGDGGSAGDPQDNGQDPGTLLGAMLRLDVDNGGESGYAIPPDNPYLGVDSGLNEIWATGLRNPWRFSFDRVTGDLFIADVGQNIYEEVNYVPAGHPAPINYGWNIMEALHCFRTEGCEQEGLYLPAIEYSHAQGGCSVTGGYVYRGERFPALRGNYFYSDYCSGMVWSFLPPDGEPRLVANTSGNVTSFGEDAAGEIYLLTQQGDIYHLQP